MDQAALLRKHAFPLGRCELLKAIQAFQEETASVEIT